MDAAAVSEHERGASDLLLGHCFALDRQPTAETDAPTAVDRLEALIGTEMARRLLLALSGRR
jgi:hypothetical protein